jgi:DNA (cytosine-5)-methyltransferase 1
MPYDSLKIIDLFCGVGGFSLGSHGAGFHVTSAFDIDPVLTSSFTKNFPETKLHLIDIYHIRGTDIEELVGSRVDGIFGGPPCQGFSAIGRQTPNDPRNILFLKFFDLVADLQPAFFVLENVPGVFHPKNKQMLEAGLSRLGENYSVVEPRIIDACDFGAATRRKRLFVVGANTDRMAEFPSTLLDPDVTSVLTVKDAISTLPSPGQIERIIFDADQYSIALDEWFEPKRLDYRDRGVSGFQETLHAAEIVSRFSKIPQGGKDEKSRYPRLSWDKPAPTLRAGTGSDRGSYQAPRPIHPSEPRVISVREAARIQGFPDWFEFHETKWHSHRMIGNSVSPIVSRVIFSRIAEHLNGVKLDDGSRRAGDPFETHGRRRVQEYEAGSRPETVPA